MAEPTKVDFDLAARVYRADNDVLAAEMIAKARAGERAQCAALVEAASDLSLWTAAALDALQVANPTGVSIDYGFQAKARVDRFHDAAMMGGQ